MVQMYSILPFPLNILYPSSFWKAWRWHCAFLGRLRGLSLPHVQAQHSGSLPHRRRPKWQHEPGQWGRVASIPQGLVWLTLTCRSIITHTSCCLLISSDIWFCVFIVFKNIRWAALTHIATTLGLAFRRSTCVNTADISQWLELQDKCVLMWEFKGRRTSLKKAILKCYLLFSCYINYYIRNKAAFIGVRYNKNGNNLKFLHFKYI